MSEAIKIRPVEPEDWAAIADVHAQPRVIWGTFRMPHRSNAFHRERLANPPRGMTYLAAIIDDRLIGAAGLHTVPDHPRRAHAASIGMAVHDAFHGRGAGAALLSALLEHADKWLGLTRVELTVWADNTRAIGLYERFGFEREGVFRRYGLRAGEYVDAVTMARLR
jgi:putative acetyltransferase